MRRALLVLALSVLLYGPASASLITFTGGTGTRPDTSTFVTNNTTTYSNVDYYVQDGYRFDFVGNATSQYIGTYYGGTNDVLHAHFDNTPLNYIRVSRVDGGLFDLQSLRVTSNTAVGGGNATGAELTYVKASQDGSTYSSSQLLPPDAWGGTSALVNFGSSFTNLKYFDIDIDNYVFCVGIDDVQLIQSVPVPSSIIMAGIGGAIIMGYSQLRYRRKMRQAAC